MDNISILEKYKKEEERLLVARLFDKISLCEKQNKIQVTDFLSPIELQILKNVLNIINYKNYKIYGGTDNAQRKLIIIYPEKLETVFADRRFDYNSICNCVRISNCDEKFEHKVYLGGCLKLGLKREKIGDIIVVENGADIVVRKEISKFLVLHLHDLTRFRNSKIEVVDVNDITEKVQEYQEFKIIVSSLRLDNVVGELAKTSRNKAVDILKQERVFIDYKNEVKPTKLVVDGNIITIRGCGKFVIEEIAGSTRSGKYVVVVKKFV